LLPKSPKLEGCYPVDTLSAKQKADLYVGRGNPIFLVGGKKIVCTCYDGGSIAGAGEEGHLAGADEEGRLAGAGEEGHLAGADEEGRLAGNFSALSCRIVPDCSGFQVTGYAPKQIKILTENGQKSVPTSCVTW
jgi:hypothetical protein